MWRETSFFEAFELPAIFWVASKAVRMLSMVVENGLLGKAIALLSYRYCSKAVARRCWLGTFNCIGLCTSVCKGKSVTLCYLPATIPLLTYQPVNGVQTQQKT
jgi:hypothetical protein